MKLSFFFHILVLPVAFLVVSAISQVAESTQSDSFPTADSAMYRFPSFEQDEKGNRKLLDFSVTPLSISNPDMLFSHFSNRNLVIFYFSAKCVHCRKAFPHILSLAGELSESSVTTIAIAVRNSSENDIRNFIRMQNCTLPVFHDVDRSFGIKYGTGSIPIVVAVNHYGEYLIFKDFEPDITPDQIKKVFKETR